MVAVDCVVSKELSGSEIYFLSFLLLGTQEGSLLWLYTVWEVAVSQTPEEIIFFFEIESHVAQVGLKLIM